MARISQLKVQIIDETTEETTLRGLLQDNSHFEIKVPKGTIRKTKSTEDGFPVGWLPVENFGQRQSVVSIRLPSPILDKGHNVNVNVMRLRNG